MRAAAIVVAIVSVLTVAAPAAGAPARTVFTVSAPSRVQTTTAAELARWARMVRRSAPGTPLKAARRSAFDLLLSYAWLEGEAAERGIVVADETVTRALARQIREAFADRRKFRRFLRDSGQTTQDVWWRVRIDLLSQRIRKQVIAPVAASVTDADIDAYIAEHGVRTVPERRDVRLILTERRRFATRAKRELSQGASWRAVARRYSLDPAREDGARQDGVERGSLERRLERAVFRAPIGRIGGPVRTPIGHYVFVVVRIHPSHPIPEARWRRTVRALLVARAQQAALDRFVAAFSASWRSRTVCGAGYRRQPRCGNPPR